MIEATSDCLLGHDFLQTIICDKIFSEGKLKNDGKTLVPFYGKEFSFDEKQVFREVAIEKVSNPQHHLMIAPGMIPGQKAPPMARVALFEHHELFKNNENQVAQDALSRLEKGIIPITISNTIDEVLKIYKNTTLGLSQLVSDRLIHEMNQKQTRNCNEVDPEYDWRT